MKKKSRIIATSIASIAMCASLAVGGTFALFTSESTVNVAVTSGKVDVNATIVEESLQTYSYVWNGVEDRYDSVATDANGVFTNGGTATFDSQARLALDLMSPGDKATFTIDVENESNISVKYRVRLFAEGELAEALVATASIEGKDYVLQGVEDKKTLWQTAVAKEEIEDIQVTVEFPDSEKANDYMNKSATLTYTVEAVQGNANVVDHEVSEADKLQAAFEEGGYVTYGGTWEGEESLCLGDNDVVLGKSELTNKNIQSSCPAIIQSYTGSTLTLASGASLTANDIGKESYGVFLMDSDIVLEEGSKLTARGANVRAIAVQPNLNYVTKIYLNGSELIEVSDGATGISLHTQGYFEIYVESYEDYGYYKNITWVENSTSNVAWFVKGALVATDEANLLDALAKGGDVTLVDDVAFETTA